MSSCPWERGNLRLVGSMAEFDRVAFGGALALALALAIVFGLETLCKKRALEEMQTNQHLHKYP